MRKKFAINAKCAITFGTDFKWEQVTRMLDKTLYHDMYTDRPGIAKLQIFFNTELQFGLTFPLPWPHEAT